MILLMLAATTAAVPAQPVDGAKVAARAALAANWIVDLSTDPKTPYVRPMNLVLADDGTVSGSFYQSPIDVGRWKYDRNRICVSFRTHDERGPYHSAACLNGDHVEGQTWAEARSFLFNWNASKAK